MIDSSFASNCDADLSQQRKKLEAGVMSELQGIARFKFHEGKLEEFKRLAATGLVAGALLGEPSAELRAMMADSTVRLFTPYESM